MSNNRNGDLDSDDEGYVGPIDDQELESDNEPEEQLPPRRQHKYTTRDLQPDRPWKRWCLICLAFLVVIAMMVLLSIFFQKLFQFY